MLRRTVGSALLTALFIMTLVAIAATAMSTRLQLDIYRTHLSSTSDKLYLASQGIIFWAMDKLANKKIPILVKEDGSLLTYPPNFLSDYSQFKMKGMVYDLQAKFNLNNLQDNKYQNGFIQLLKSCGIPKGNDQRIATALFHWINPPRLDQGKNPFEEYYLAQKPPYLPANVPLSSISELRLIADVSPAIYQKLEPYLCVLPEVTPININTASKRVLKTLGNGVNDKTINEIIAARGNKGLRDLQKIAPLLKKADIPVGQITLESQYFLIVASVEGEDMHLLNYTVVKRVSDNNSKVNVGIVAESLNAL